MIDQFLKAALNAIKSAEDIIMHYYHSYNIETKLKSDLTPVTVADQESEKVIKEIIHKSFPDHGFLGEETGSIEGNSSYTWIIDPIDGTKNYAKKIPFFATQVALMKGKELILGVSNAPALNELLYATKNNGAFMNHQRIQVSTVEDISNAMICFGSIKTSIKKNQTENLLKLIAESSRDRGFGDFYIYHMVASGRAEIAVEHYPLKIWDIAAMKIITEEAGGCITDLNGNSIEDKVESVLATNGKLHDRVLQYFK